MRRKPERPAGQRLLAASTQAPCVRRTPTIINKADAHNSDVTLHFKVHGMNNGQVLSIDVLQANRLADGIIQGASAKPVRVRKPAEQHNTKNGRGAALSDPKGRRQNGMERSFSTPRLAVMF